MNVAMKVVMEKSAKPFPTYLMNPANRETFHPRNFYRLRYVCLKALGMHISQITSAHVTPII